MVAGRQSFHAFELRQYLIFVIAVFASACRRSRDCVSIVFFVMGLASLSLPTFPTRIVKRKS